MPILFDKQQTVLPSEEITYYIKLYNYLIIKNAYILEEKISKHVFGFKSVFCIRVVSTAKLY